MTQTSPQNDEEATPVLIAQLRRIMDLFHVKSDDTVFPQVRADIVSTLDARTPPKVVTGTYQTPEQFVHDAVLYYTQQRGITRVQVPAGALGVFGEIAHAMDFLLRSGCVLYSGRRADGAPEFYVGLTTTCTQCVAVSFTHQGS